MKKPGIWFLPWLLAGCAASAPVAVVPEFVDPVTGFHLEVPATFEPAGKVGSYFLTDNWRADRREQEPGRTVAAWQLKDSNAVLMALLRYGYSADANSVAHCLEPATGVENQPTSQVQLGGLPFTRYRFSDAGMNHFMEVEAWRSHHEGRCLAIDLVVQGTNPLVYEPPRSLPFTRAEAEKQLHELLLEVEWLTRE